MDITSAVLYDATCYHWMLSLIVISCSCCQILIFELCRRILIMVFKEISAHQFLTGRRTNISSCALLWNVIQWFRRHVVYQPPSVEELPPPLTCVRGGWARLEYFKRVVFALQQQIRHRLCFMSTFRDGRCHRVHGLIVMLWWICMIFMNQMLGVIHHMRCGCRTISGGPWCDNISKACFFFVFHCRISAAVNPTALGDVFMSL